MMIGSRFLSVAVICIIACLVADTFASAPYVSVFPNELKEEQAVIRVFWNLMPAKPKDYIALVGRTTKRTYSKYETGGTVTGSKNISVINFREDYEFTYIMEGDVVVASEIVWVNKNYPTQGHISLAGENEMSVMFVTYNITTPMVRYGEKENNLHMTQKGFSKTYTKEQLCGLGAVENWIEPGQINEVVLKNLKQNTTYYYSYGSEEGGWSKVSSFKSAPVVSAETPVTMYAFGDSGTATCQEMTGWCEKAAAKTYANIKKDMQERKSDLIVHIGDISYAVGHSWRWEQYFHDIESIATRLPYLVCIGNHEYDHMGQPFKPSWGNYGNDSGGECGVPYMHRFSMPTKQGDNKNLWYSIDYGNIHIAFLSTEHDFLPGSEQLAWLEQDLKSVNRSITPWLFLGVHRPLYSTAADNQRNKIGQMMRKSFESLLLKYQVDLVLQGHEHSYQRTCPLYLEKCQSGKAPIYLVIGMGGMHLTGKFAKSPSWLIYKEAAYGYSRIITTKRTLKFEFVENSHRVVKDSFELHK